MDRPSVVSNWLGQKPDLAIQVKSDVPLSPECRNPGLSLYYLFDLEQCSGSARLRLNILDHKIYWYYAYMSTREVCVVFIPDLHWTLPPHFGGLITFLCQEPPPPQKNNECSRMNGTCSYIITTCDAHAARQESRQDTLTLTPWKFNVYFCTSLYQACMTKAP